MEQAKGIGKNSYNYTNGFLVIKNLVRFSTDNSGEVKKWFLILAPFILISCFKLQAQTGSCVLQEPGITINFGSGYAEELNISTSYTYGRVQNTCPTDGHYAYTPFTSDCFRGDWITLDEDHTSGDNQGNMLLVNASYRSGEFFNTMASGMKPGATYEFSVWMLNVCKPSEKCPFPLLPNITIQIKTPSGTVVSALNTGDLQRYGRAQWTKYNVMFVMPKGVNSLDITMTNHSPGGCGNDFAMDDISFKECVRTPPPVTKKKPAPTPTRTTTTTQPTVKKEVTATKKDVAATPPPVKKPAAKPVAKTTVPVTAKKENTTATIPKPVQANAPVTDSVRKTAVTTPRSPVYAPPPPLVNRTNSLVKKIETGPGNIKVELFDNGQIDGDTVSIYHNNKLILSRVRLSEKAISFLINIDENNPHHELVMVANNLGSIPPNTSLMYVTAGTKRYEVFISSNEQNNAKVVFDLKE